MSLVKNTLKLLSNSGHSTTSKHTDRLKSHECTRGKGSGRLAGMVPLRGCDSQTIGGTNGDRAEGWRGVESTGSEGGGMDRWDNTRYDATARARGSEGSRNCPKLLRGGGNKVKKNMVIFGDPQR